MINEFLTVTTFLWNDPHRVRSYKFEPKHVQILRNMVRRNLTIPHEFVCVTDSQDVADILVPDGIRCVPITWEKHVPGTCFVRLFLRKPGIGGLLGRRIMNIDIDCVITGNLDHIASRPEPCIWWRNPNFPAPKRAFYQTSLQLFNSGTCPELWSDFDPKVTPTWVNRRFGGAEQAWVSERLSWDYPHFDEKDGVYGAGRLFGAIEDKGVKSELPENAKIVFTPGDRMPDQPEMRERCPWINRFYA